MAIKTRLKKNDMVKVISGNSRGTTGKILFVDREKGRVIVEGVNIIHRHTKPSQKSPQGGIVRREAPINISNVMLMDPKAGEPTRIGSEVIKDEKTGKVRRMRKGIKSGEIIIS
ncbi:MAG: 50S ribosomal protein L24 [Bacteroidetes bacterium]|mgnify:FL=1|nr:50S ribosomal protein L24 [Bacteroidota bacterium]MBX7046411.1 50S ribosomal protein L24 [Ignavibacteria bacterium]